MAGIIIADTIRSSGNTVTLNSATQTVATINATGIYSSAGNLLAAGTFASPTFSGTVAGTYTLGGTPTISSPTISSPTVTGTTSFPDGSASAPSIFRAGDTNTGVFFPAADTLAASTGGSERMRIDSSGNVKFAGSISVGDATPTTSGAGITFPATQSASSDANTLDDYEEGTWTPGIVGSSGSAGAQAYSVQAGRYIKIGRFVLLTGYLTLTNKGSWTGAATINNFPFTVNSGNASYSAHNFYYAGVSLPANNFSMGAYVEPGATTAQLYSTHNGGTTNTDYSAITNSTQMGPWQFCYFTSA